MKSLNFIGGEKGGVGKSLISRVLAQYFIDHDKPFTGFDTDRSHASFKRFYQDYASRVIVDTYEGLDLIVADFEDCADQQTDKHVIVDLGALTITVPELHETSMRKIDAQNASFWAAINNRQGQDTLGLLERQRVKSWLKNT